MDIDIDVQTNFRPEKIIDVIRASQIEKGELKPHNAGVYLQTMPKDSLTGLAAIPYKQAEEYGFIKFDMLHLNLLNFFKSKDEMLKLMEVEPNWKLLEEREFVEKLFHLSKQFDTVYKVKPKSVIALADVLMLIRPHKVFLIDKYI